MVHSDCLLKEFKVIWSQLVMIYLLVSTAIFLFSLVNMNYDKMVKLLIKYFPIFLSWAVD